MGDEHKFHAAKCIRCGLKVAEAGGNCIGSTLSGDADHYFVVGANGRILSTHDTLADARKALAVRLAGLNKEGE